MRPVARLLWVLLFVISGCTREMTSRELDAYLANTEHGLTQKQEVGDLTIEVMYRPTSAMAVVDDQKGQEFLAAQYYLLSISRKGTEALDPTRGFSAFSSLLQTLAFRPSEYMVLTTSKGDTLSPNNSILERTYGMGASTRVLVAFPALPSGTQADVQFHLNEFGLRTGNLCFPFKLQDIQDIPALKSSSTQTK